MPRLRADDTQILKPLHQKVRPGASRSKKLRVPKSDQKVIKKWDNVCHSDSLRKVLYSVCKCEDGSCVFFFRPPNYIFAFCSCVFVSRCPGKSPREHVHPTTHYCNTLKLNSLTTSLYFHHNGFNFDKCELAKQYKYNHRTAGVATCDTRAQKKFFSCFSQKVATNWWPLSQRPHLRTN